MRAIAFQPGGQVRALWLQPSKIGGDVLSVSAGAAREGNAIALSHNAMLRLLGGIGRRVVLTWSGRRGRRRSRRHVVGHVCSDVVGDRCDRRGGVLRAVFKLSEFDGREHLSMRGVGKVERLKKCRLSKEGKLDRQLSARVLGTLSQKRTDCGGDRLARATRNQGQERELRRAMRLIRCASGQNGQLNAREDVKAPLH